MHSKGNSRTQRISFVHRSIIFLIFLFFLPLFPTATVLDILRDALRWLLSPRIVDRYSRLEEKHVGSERYWRTLNNYVFYILYLWLSTCKWEFGVAVYHLVTEFWLLGSSKRIESLKWKMEKKSVWSLENDWTWSNIIRFADSWVTKTKRVVSLRKKRRLRSF